MRVLCLLIVAMLTMTVPASASVIWQGDPARGTAQFGNMNCDKPGSVTAADDAQRGKVWRYHKPSGSNRCENHGISVGGKRYVFQGGQTYWFGWSSKLSSTVNNNATFQWKSYGNHKQNFPVVLKVIGGRIHMLHSPVGGSDRLIWNAPITANVWQHFALGLYLSPDAGKGWVELLPRRQAADVRQRHDPLPLPHAGRHQRAEVGSLRRQWADCDELRP